MCLLILRKNCRILFLNRVGSPQSVVRSPKSVGKPVSSKHSQKRIIISSDDFERNYAWCVEVHKKMIGLRKGLGYRK